LDGLYAVLKGRSSTLGLKPLFWGPLRGAKAPLFHIRDAFTLGTAGLLFHSARVGGNLPPPSNAAEDSVEERPFQGSVTAPT
jgi:hypothetical protein